MVAQAQSPGADDPADRAEVGGRPLLIVHDGSVVLGDNSVAVEVTGEVAERFDVVGAEEFVVGDLDDGLFADFNGEPYIQAETVELLPVTD